MHITQKKKGINVKELTNNDKVPTEYRNIRIK